MYSHSIFPVFSIVLAIQSSLTIGAEVEIKLEPATTSIRAEDPLLVKVRIANRIDQVVTFDHGLSTSSGTIWFEIRKLPDASFNTFLVAYQGMSHGSSVWRSLEGGDELVSHEVLCRDVDKSPFAEPGEYELRATLRDVQGIEGTSKAVSIRVSPISSNEQKAIIGASRLLPRCFGFVGISTEVKAAAELNSLREKLTPSIMRSTLDWTIAIAKIRDAHSTEEFEKAQAEFAQLRRKMDVVTRERAKLVLIGEYIRINEFDDAFRELLTLKFNSSQKEILWTQLIERSYRQRREQERNAAPPGAVPVN